MNFKLSQNRISAEGVLVLQGLAVTPAGPRGNNFTNTRLVVMVTRSLFQNIAKLSTAAVSHVPVRTQK
jgi:hypothetical protein